MRLNLIVPGALIHKRVGMVDRRVFTLKSFLLSLYKGTRASVRRNPEIKQGYYIDTYEKNVGFMLLAIICLSTFDAFFTLNILDKGGVEVNPLMHVLLSYDIKTFLMVKMGLTVACAFFVLVHINFHLFNILSVKLILKGILVIYLGLMGYEIFLLLVM